MSIAWQFCFQRQQILMFVMRFRAQSLPTVGIIEIVPALVPWDAIFLRHLILMRRNPMAKTPKTPWRQINNKRNTYPHCHIWQLSYFAVSIGLFICVLVMAKVWGYQRHHWRTIYLFEYQAMQANQLSGLRCQPRQKMDLTVIWCPSIPG